MTAGTFKSEKIDRQGHQKWAQGNQNGARSEPKGAIRSPKGNQRGQKGTKSDPMGDQNASKDRLSEKVAETSRKRSSARDYAGPFWEPFSIKNALKINAKIDVEKVC